MKTQLKPKLGWLVTAYTNGERTVLARLEDYDKANEYAERNRPCTIEPETPAQTEQRDTAAECQHCGDSATKQIKIQGATIAVCDDCDESLYERDTATNEIKFHKGTCIPKRDFLLHDYGKVAQVQQRDTATQPQIERTSEDKLRFERDMARIELSKTKARAERLAVDLRSIGEMIDDAVNQKVRNGRMPNTAQLLQTIRDISESALAQWKGEQK